MATIGQTLTAPEAGWRRYDNKDSRIIYDVSWAPESTSNTPPDYNNTRSVSSVSGDTVSFKYYGTKIRVLGSRSTARPSNDGADVYIDDVLIGSINQYNSAPSMVTLDFEQSDLVKEPHTVKIVTKNLAPSTLYFVLDAIDIDSNGYLLHPKLIQRTKLEDMQDGDCIPCRYTAKSSGAAGYFSEFGTCTADEIPVTGTATPNGLFYFVKVDDGLLIADRNIQHTISWDVLNNAKLVEGGGYYYSERDKVITRITKGGRIQLPYTSTLKPNTLMIKIRMTANYADTTYNYPLSSAQSGGYSILFGNGIIIFEAYINGGYKQVVANVSNYINKETEFIGSFDGRYLRLYINKTLIATNDLGGIFNITHSNLALMIGGNPEGGNTIINPFGGDWRDIVIWRTPFDVTTIDNNNINISDSNLIAYYDSKNISGTTLLDSSVNKLNGTLIGTVASVTLPDIEYRSNYNSRIISGGNSYLGSDGLSKLTNQGLGAWPPNNEWDTYIVNSTLGGKITPGDTNIWHWKDYTGITICRDTLVLNTVRQDGTKALASDRMNRSWSQAGAGSSYEPVLVQPWFNASNFSSTVTGFRPIFEYKHEKQTNIWY